MLSLDSSQSVQLSKWVDVDAKALVRNSDGGYVMEQGRVSKLIDDRERAIADHLGQEVMVFDSEQGHYVDGILHRGNREGVVALQVQAQQGFAIVEIESYNITDLRVAMKSH